MHSPKEIEYVLWGAVANFAGVGTFALLVGKVSLPIALLIAGVSTFWYLFATVFLRFFW
jgi:hypothetical protein